MKRIAPLPALLIVLIVTKFVAGCTVAAFLPSCGSDCDNTTAVSTISLANDSVGSVTAEQPKEASGIDSNSRSESVSGETETVEVVIGEHEPAIIESDSSHRRSHRHLPRNGMVVD